MKANFVVIEHLKLSVHQIYITLVHNSYSLNEAKEIKKEKLQKLAMFTALYRVLTARITYASYIFLTTFTFIVHLFYSYHRILCLLFPFFHILVKFCVLFY